MGDDAGNIKVCLRLRPFNDREKGLNCTLCVDMPTKTKVVVTGEDVSPATAASDVFCGASLTWHFSWASPGAPPSGDGAAAEEVELSPEERQRLSAEEVLSPRSSARSRRPWWGPASSPG